MEILLKILVIGLPLLVAVILHEIAHGLAAERFGDRTAREQGRITLNPLPHIDPFLTLLLPGLLILAGSPIIFGGAKPVPVDPRRLQNPLKNMIWIAAAGPATNIILMLLSAAALFLLSPLFSTGLVSQLLASLLVYSVLVNLVLAVFNMFPVPPLDGSRIVAGILPRDLVRPYLRLERWGLLIIFGLLYIGAFNVVFEPVFDFVFRFLVPAGAL